MKLRLIVMEDLKAGEWVEVDPDTGTVRKAEPLPPSDIDFAALAREPRGHA